MTMNKKSILFKVPVYQETEKDFYEYLRSRRDKFIEQQMNRFRDLRVARSEADSLHQELMQATQPNPDRLAWDYNRIVGWIEFYAHGRVIKASLWFVRAKRIDKWLKNRVFDFRGKIVDVAVTDHLSKCAIHGCW